MNHPTALADRGTLPYLKRRTTLVEPSSNHPAALEEIGGTLVKLVEPSSHPAPPHNPQRNWWNPGGTLLEPWNPAKNPCGTFLKPPQTTPQPSKKLVEPNSWNPCGTLMEPCGTLMEPWWNPGGTFVELVEPSWNPRGTLPQTTPDNPAALAHRGTLVEPYLEAAPDHPGAYLG